MPVVWLRADGDGVIVSVHVQPGASRSELAGEHGDALKIRLNAPPVDGKANAALIDFFARRLDLPRNAVELVSGAASRKKRVRLSGIDPAVAEAALVVAD